MRSILTFCSVLLATYGASAQNKLELSAKMPVLGNDTIVRLYNPIAKTTDSTYVKNHSFAFSKQMDGGGSIYILQVGNTNAEKSGLGMVVYLEPGKMNISGNAKTFKDATYTGDPFVKDWIEMNKYMDTAIPDLNTNDLSLRLEEAQKVGDNDAVTSLNAQLTMYNQKLVSLSKKWINDNLNSGVSAYVLNAILAGKLSREEQLGLINKFGPKARHNEIITMMLSGLTGISEDTYGKQALNFTQPDVNGKMVSLSDFKGSYVLVDFWASWCTPCRAESPNLKAAYEKFKNKNFKIVGISLDDDKTKWLKAIAEDQLPWLQLSDLTGSKNKVAADYKVLGIPANFLIDPNGKIIGYGFRDGMLDARLTQLLK